jgi:asparagine N-glycosylation enzyme membrane subunit Stt3
MLQAWLSIGYLVLLAILVLAFILWRRGGPVLAILALVAGIPLWLKRNSERVFNDAKTVQSRNTEVTLMWNRWRSTLFSWYPNAIAIGFAGSWPGWSVRTIIFYGLSVVLWLSYFYAFFRLRRSSAPLR